MRVPSGTRKVETDAVRVSERALKLARALIDCLVFRRDSVFWFEMRVERVIGRIGGMERLVLP